MTDLSDEPVDIFEAVEMAKEAYSPCRHMGASRNRYHSGGPHNKDYGLLGLFLGSNNSGELPFNL